MSSRASLKGETRDHMEMKIFLMGPGYLSLSLKIPG